MRFEAGGYLGTAPLGEWYEEPRPVKDCDLLKHCFTFIEENVSLREIVILLSTKYMRSEE